MKKLNWNEYFIALSKVAAMRSKDENTKVGAVLINDDNRVIGMGYNGMPKGIDDFPWGREGKPADTKYPYVVHAEMNAILNATVSTKDSRIFVSLFPCSNCAKFLVQAGVKEVLYSDDKYKDTDDAAVSRKILETCGVKTTRVKDVDVQVG